MLSAAQAGGYAIAAFNIENMEMAQAVVSTAERLGAPVILQTTPSTVRYGTLALYAAMVRALAEAASVPVVLHLDHGSSVALARDALAAGYSSVMIDGSGLAFPQNVEVTQRVLALAGDIPVEAELGAIGGKEDSLSGQAALTQPEEAAAFAHACPVAALAVAIGTAHGFYKEAPRLDLSRLAAIRALVPIPLVLHGASGVPEAQVRASIEAGVCKVNYATELRAAYTLGVEAALLPGVFDPKVYGKTGRDRVAEAVAGRIALCGAEGKARA
jgi:tagatose 1,6-diphosphate aldolase GatY/KbaY